MKTIEEVIDNIVDEHKACRWMDAGELREYLEVIAQEQKAIDIDKAKKAFNKTCGWLSTYPSCESWYNELFENFIKNMEEKL